MTSCAMTAGMVPMALGWSEGGEQTAPLARAVIGGLVAATIATLTVLPTVFALVQGWAGRESASLDPDDPASTHYHEEEAEASEMARPSANGEPQRSPASTLRRATCRPAATTQEVNHPGRGTSCPESSVHLISTFATAVVLTALVTGCERPSEGKPGPAAQPARSVEVVHPERHTIRRSVGEPGELEAFETTAIHAKIAGYVNEVDGQHRSDSQEGPASRGTLGPRVGR